MSNAVTMDETQAAELEGLADLSPEVSALREKYLALKSTIDTLEKQKTAIRDEIGAYLIEGGLSGMTSNGKVVVRLSNVTTVSLDTAAIKRVHPRMFAALIKRYSKVTRSERITVTA